MRENCDNMPDMGFNPAKDRDLYLGDVTPEAIEELIKNINMINKYEGEIFEQDALLFQTIADKRDINIAELQMLAGKIEPITLHINSFGGSVYDCFSLISIIKNSITPIQAQIHYAMSAGALIASVCHYRIGYELSTIMIHNLSSASWGQLGTMREDVKQCEVLEKKIIDILVNHTKIKKDKLKQVFREKSDWYLDADEALELGIFDEIWERGQNNEEEKVEE